MVLDFLGCSAEVRGQLQLIAEKHNKELVFSIGGLQEFRHCQAGLIQFSSHAAAAVHNQPKRNRCIFYGTLHNVLFDLVFEQTETLSPEASDERILRIDHGHGDQRQRALNSDVGA